MSLPLVWVITDMGPTDAPGFLVSAVPVTVQGHQAGQVWADSATPYGYPGYLGCDHPRLHRLDDGMVTCLECAERFHPDQFFSTDPRLTGDAHE